ncbi:hypothetical protein [Acidimangrovimonas pyrenivorans]|uniref:Uncharacterized protein n=1 Tax=Acidimangrovimonas pyrenivorans TaxID=2030798 RepID=A0ABV7AED5_9RHOB
MQTPTDTYVDDATYAALRAALLSLITDPPHDADTAIVSTLGETGGIWPRSVMYDVEGA